MLSITSRGWNLIGQLSVVVAVFVDSYLKIFPLFNPSVGRSGGGCGCSLRTSRFVSQVFNEALLLLLLLCLSSRVLRVFKDLPRVSNVLPRALAELLDSS